MGFTTGFTGGVTLTLGVAYLTLLAHQRNREQQAAILRQQTYLLSSIIDPLPPTLPPTRAELAARERANITDAAKDRWNAEVESAVRWAQSKDWTEVREDAEAALGRLWARAMGTTQNGGDKGEEKKSTREKNDSVAAVAKSAYADAKAKSAELASKTEKKAEEKAEGVKDTVLGAIGKGIQKGKEVFSSAKSATGVEEKAEPTLSPVEKALQERYEKPDESKQTVEEILAARYAPIDQKDSASLCRDDMEVTILESTGRRRTYNYNSLCPDCHHELEEASLRNPIIRGQEERTEAPATEEAPPYLDHDDRRRSHRSGRDHEGHYRRRRRRGHAGDGHRPRRGHRNRSRDRPPHDPMHGDGNDDEGYVYHPQPNHRPASRERDRARDRGRERSNRVPSRRQNGLGITWQSFFSRKPHTSGKGQSKGAAIRRNQPVRDTRPTHIAAVEPSPRSPEQDRPRDNTRHHTTRATNPRSSRGRRRGRGRAGTR
ncbi:hypothetical protein O1611_g9928 [Lasiodiplodia mahajangana]|uniref:Uncharacterized protein n=1 Tax=Lasiodiplodia mahajangana TaxID=1108764 RepID=A0ACC2J448_9PEZI|nr:hypothetical protein O1611_g9928 [Lasiodiplodia mahajangana]